MAKKQKEYQRLRGKGRGFFSYNKLYLGTDHLLSVISNYLSEDYQRFYYNDIQTLTAAKTPAGRIRNVIYGLLFIVLLIPITWLRGGWSVFFSIMAGIFLLSLLINWLRGPTCITHIRTPVQTMRLTSLSRVKNLNQALQRILPLIERVQGRFDGEAMFEHHENEDLNTTSSFPVMPLKHESGTIHKCLFCLMLIYAVFIFIDIFHQNMILSLFSSLIIMVITMLLIIALVRQTGSDLNRSLKIMTWSTIPCMSLVLISSYMIFIYAAIKNPAISHNQWELIKHFSALAPRDYPLLMAYSVFDLSFSLIIGLTGLILTLRYQKMHRNALRLNPAQTPLAIDSGYE